MKIVVNGQEYSSPDQLPPEAREAYERAKGLLVDRDGNGIPDVLELALDKSRGASTGASGPSMRIHTSQTIVVNGREYASLDDVPPDARQRIEKLQERLQEKRRASANPLDPAHRTLRRGLLGTDPLTMVWIAVLIAGAITIVALPIAIYLWQALR